MFNHIIKNNYDALYGSRVLEKKDIIIKILHLILEYFQIIFLQFFLI